MSLSEDARGLPFTDVNVKAGLSPRLLLDLEYQGLNRGLLAYWNLENKNTTPHVLSISVGLPLVSHVPVVVLAQSPH